MIQQKSLVLIQITGNVSEMSTKHYVMQFEFIKRKKNSPYDKLSSVLSHRHISALKAILTPYVLVHFSSTALPSHNENFKNHLTWLVFA